MGGSVPFDWVEIEAYNRMSQAGLTPVEASCLLEMSRAFCEELSEREALRIAPMERDI